MDDLAASICLVTSTITLVALLKILGVFANVIALLLLVPIIMFYAYERLMHINEGERRKVMG